MKTKRLISNNYLKLVLFSIYFGLFCNPTVYAGVENRPINTDDAYTLDKRTLTTSLGVTFAKARNGDKETALYLDLGYGVTDRFEITVDIPFAFLDLREGENVEGLGDISIRPEILLIEERGSVPAISFAATFKTNSGDRNKGLGSGENDYSLSLQFSEDLKPLKCHLNIGYSFVGQPKGEAVDDIIFYSSACEYALNSRLALACELIGEANPRAGDHHNPLGGLIGLLYGIHGNRALDFGIGSGFTHVSSDIQITGGLTYQFLID